MDTLTQAPVSAQDALFIAQDLADLAAQGSIPEPDRRPEPCSLECPLCSGTGVVREDDCHGCRGLGQVFDLDEYFSLCNILAFLEVA